MRNFVTNHIFPEEVKYDILREDIGDEAYKTRLRKTIYKFPKAYVYNQQKKIKTC